MPKHRQNRTEVRKKYTN